VEAIVQALLEAVDINPPERIKPCDIQKLINFLKFRKACGMDGIPNQFPRHLPRRPPVHLTHLINYYIRFSHYPTSWKEGTVKMLYGGVRTLNSPPNLRPISLLSTMCELFESVVLKIVQKHI
jgi:hypothetical protein